MKAHFQILFNYFYFYDCMLIAGKNMVRPRVQRFSGNQHAEQPFPFLW